MQINTHGIVQLHDTTRTVINPATEDAQTTGNLSLSAIETDIGTVVTDLSTIITLMGGSGVRTNIYNENIAVTSGVPTNIVSYTVPLGKNFALKYVEGSGNLMGEFTVIVDGNAIRKRRSYFTDYNVDFTISDDGIYVAATKVISVQILHTRGSAGKFNASIYGVLI